MDIIILLVHAMAGWALCGMIMTVALKLTTERRALVIHAVGAPIVFVLVSAVYFDAFHYTSPFETASVFVGVVVVMDAGLVAPVIEKSFAMFRSVLGTWLPFGLIFLATYLTGVGLLGAATLA